MIIGCHLSTARGFETAVANARRLGADAFQYFPKNPRSYRIKPVRREELQAGARAAAEAGVLTVTHSAYVTNLATGDPGLRETTIASIVNELEISEALGTRYLVVHCGKHLGDAEDAGMARMAGALDEVLERYSGSCRLLLENTAGQGTELGHTLDQLLDIRGRVARPDRLGFCLDSCHAFAAGWLAPDGWDRFLQDVLRPEFLDHLEVVHLNDSKGSSGDRVDRHALLGEGRMGGLLARFLTEPAFSTRPVIIETPVAEEDEYAGEIARARRWSQDEAGNMRQGEHTGERARSGAAT